MWYSSLKTRTIREAGLKSWRKAIEVKKFLSEEFDALDEYNKSSIIDILNSKYVIRELFDLYQALSSLDFKFSNIKNQLSRNGDNVYKWILNKWESKSGYVDLIKYLHGLSRFIEQILENPSALSTIINNHDSKTEIIKYLTWILNPINQILKEHADLAVNIYASQAVSSSALSHASPPKATDTALSQASDPFMDRLLDSSDQVDDYVSA